MFTISKPLRIGDCAPCGIAYFPSYLNILVWVLEEFFASLGLPWRAMNGERRISVPTVRLDLTFRSPGFQGDELDSRSRSAIARSPRDLQHAVSATDAVLWTAKHRIVTTSIDTNASPAWPDAIRATQKQQLEMPHAHDPAT
ncbi:acyl-CoA thioesterase [Rhizobium sp. PL01]|uniref:acyl-CoA thioesterase n=1 Tax=Rhizobium sp. PL01 TaxID=3085631 RepID=UPI00298297CC|nr:acyl-CoA thioesterase [Rhizobium sp. PL01]MDW5316070.1 acyl-CoA thioesterase [Rhizobium sp. PL01]